MYKLAGRKGRRLIFYPRSIEMLSKKEASMMSYSQRTLGFYNQNPNRLKPVKRFKGAACL